MTKLNFSYGYWFYWLNPPPTHSLVCLTEVLPFDWVNCSEASSPCTEWVRGLFSSGIWKEDICTMAFLSPPLLPFQVCLHRLLVPMPVSALRYLSDTKTQVAQISATLCPHRGEFNSKHKGELHQTSKSAWQWEDCRNRLNWNTVSHTALFLSLKSPPAVKLQFSRCAEQRGWAFLFSGGYG